MRWATLFLAALLTGCAVAGPSYRSTPLARGETPPPVLVEAAWPAFEPAPLPARWWRLYDDPALDALVEQALARNTDLRVALATLQQYEALVREAKAERTPTTDLSASAAFAKKSMMLDATQLFDVAGDLSYDVDLFGRLRRGVEAARADAGAAAAALDLARVNVAAGVAKAYVDACAAGLQIDVATRSVGVAKASVEVARRRLAAGLDGANDVVRARTLYDQALADLPDLEARRRSALFQLATLTGEPPEGVPPAAAGCRTPPPLARPIPVGDGAALLARRPDLRQAERKLAGAVARIGVATAALYPSVTIGASGGGTATAINRLSTRSAVNFNLGPMLSWSFPNTSVARAQIAAADAEARGALASYDGTVLTALRETESALVTLARRMETARVLRRARDDAAIARRNVRRLYSGGVGEFLDVLDAERTLIGAESALAMTTQQVAEDQVALFLALGGGWQEAPPVTDVGLATITTPRDGAFGRRP